MTGGANPIVSNMNLGCPIAFLGYMSREGREIFFEEMDASKLQRIQSDHMAIWAEFRECAERKNAWRPALRMLLYNRNSFAEVAAFVGYKLPD